MKKFEALVLALCLTLTIAGCGGNEAKPNSDSKSEQKTTQEVAGDETKGEAVDAESAKGDSAEAAKPSEDSKSVVAEEKTGDGGTDGILKQSEEGAVTTEEKKDKEFKSTENFSGDGTPKSETGTTSFSFGTQSGLIYENKYIGIKFNAPDATWKFLDVDNGNLENITDAAEFEKAAETTKVINLMMAQNGDGTANLVCEKLSGQARNISEQDYMKAARSNMEKAFEQGGVTSTKFEDGSIQVGGRAIPAIKFSYKNIDSKTYHQISFCMKKDSYMALASVVCTDEAQLMKILSAFHSA